MVVWMSDDLSYNYLSWWISAEWLNQLPFDNGHREHIMCIWIHIQGGVLKSEMPQAMGFNTKMVYSWMIWAYPNFRTPPCVCCHQSVLTESWPRCITLYTMYKNGDGLGMAAMMTFAESQIFIAENNLWHDMTGISIWPSYGSYDLGHPGTRGPTPWLHQTKRYDPAPISQAPIAQAPLRILRNKLG